MCLKVTAKRSSSLDVTLDFLLKLLHGVGWVLSAFVRKLHKELQSCVTVPPR